MTKVTILIATLLRTSLASFCRQRASHSDIQGLPGCLLDLGIGTPSLLDST